MMRNALSSSGYDKGKDYLPDTFFASRLLYGVLKRDHVLSADDVDVLLLARSRVESMIEGMGVVSGSIKYFSGAEPISAYRLALDIIPARFDLKVGADIGRILFSVRDEISATLAKGEVRLGDLKTALPFFEGYGKLARGHSQQQSMDRFSF